jgi:hypothetical protein
MEDRMEFYNIFQITLCKEKKIYFSHVIHNSYMPFQKNSQFIN